MAAPRGPWRRSPGPAGRTLLSRPVEGHGTRARSYVPPWSGRPWMRRDGSRGPLAAHGCFARTMPTLRSRPASPSGGRIAPSPPRRLRRCSVGPGRRRGGTHPGLRRGARPSLVARLAARPPRIATAHRAARRPGGRPGAPPQSARRRGASHGPCDPTGDGGPAGTLLAGAPGGGRGPTSRPSSVARRGRRTRERGRTWAPPPTTACARPRATIGSRRPGRTRSSEDRWVPSSATEPMRPGPGRPRGGRGDGRGATPPRCRLIRAPASRRARPPARGDAPDREILGAEDARRPPGRGRTPRAGPPGDGRPRLATRKGRPFATTARGASGTPRAADLEDRAATRDGAAERPAQASRPPCGPIAGVPKRRSKGLRRRAGSGPAGPSRRCTPRGEPRPRRRPSDARPGRQVREHRRGDRALRDETAGRSPGPGGAARIRAPWRRESGGHGGPGPSIAGQGGMSAGHATMLPASAARARTGPLRRNGPWDGPTAARPTRRMSASPSAAASGRVTEQAATTRDASAGGNCAVADTAMSADGRSHARWGRAGSVGIGAPDAGTPSRCSTGRTRISSAVPRAVRSVRPGSRAPPPRVPLGRGAEVPEGGVARTLVGHRDPGRRRAGIRERAVVPGSFQPDRGPGRTGPSPASLGAAARPSPIPSAGVPTWAGPGFRRSSSPQGLHRRRAAPSMRRPRAGPTDDPARERRTALASRDRDGAVGAALRVPGGERAARGGGPRPPAPPGPAHPERTDAVPALGDVLATLPRPRPRRDRPAAGGSPRSTWVRDAEHGPARRRARRGARPGTAPARQLGCPPGPAGRGPALASAGLALRCRRSWSGPDGLRASRDRRHTRLRGRPGRASGRGHPAERDGARAWSGMSGGPSSGRHARIAGSAP